MFVAINCSQIVFGSLSFCIVILLISNRRLLTLLVLRKAQVLLNFKDICIVRLFFLSSTNTVIFLD